MGGVDGLMGGGDEGGRELFLGRAAHAHAGDVVTTIVVFRLDIARLPFESDNSATPGCRGNRQDTSRKVNEFPKYERSCHQECIY